MLRDRVGPISLRLVTPRCLRTESLLSSLSQLHTCTKVNTGIAPQSFRGENPSAARQLSTTILNSALFSTEPLQSSRSKLRTGGCRLFCTIADHQPTAMSSLQGDSPRASLAWRKSHACNECKRRKVRCSGGAKCSNCIRDGKDCRYSSALQTITTLQRQVLSHQLDHLSQGTFMLTCPV